LSIGDRQTVCFHVAIICNNTDIENVKAVCSQAVLHRSTDNDPLLFFAVYDGRTQMVYFCLLDPKLGTFEDVAQFQMLRQETHVAARLQTMWLPTQKRCEMGPFHRLLTMLNTKLGDPGGNRDAPSIPTGQTETWSKAQEYCAGSRGRCQCR
jgi:hypothetical protein